MSIIRLFFFIKRCIWTNIVLKFCYFMTILPEFGLELSKPQPLLNTTTSKP